MSTKTTPGAMDDYADLAQDEPYFILRASRPEDVSHLRKWAFDHRIGDSTTTEADEALKCAEAMERWREANLGLSTSADALALVAFNQIHSEKHDPNMAFEQCPEPVCIERQTALADILKLKSQERLK